MTPEEWKRVKAILEPALGLPEAERTGYVVRACGDDEGLRREVQSLLDAERGDWSFFDRGSAPRPTAEAGTRHRPGERIGPYEIAGEIGRGGMGEVYLARRADEEFEQKVAIKFIRPGVADDDALHRFRKERQISASLDHPGIARLLDGGTTESGEPYFVMEYVEGEGLLEYSRRHALSVEARLRLFRDVCAAVRYAHQNLVVHRDIKPGNILVTAEGLPKLLDFGIAKLIHTDGGVPEDRTATLFRMLTPDYASPEQVRGQPVTTASDVYSLGVVLYELLTGRRPYHLDTSDASELVRVVCEQDPERPSTVVDRAPHPERPAATSRELRGDLDAIVLKAMRKEPGARYGSVDQLDDDVRRHLEGRPVLARHGTFSYRAGKFVRRHRVLLAAAALVAIALAGGIVSTLRETHRARLAEARAKRRFDDVRKIANSFLFEFHDAIRDLPGSTPARALVVRRALEYLDSLASESSDDPTLRRELAEAYQKVGDVEGNPYLQSLGDLKGALASYDKSIALLEPAVVSGRATDEERATLANAYVVAGGMQVIAGDSKKAVAMAEKGLGLRRTLAEKKPGDAGQLRGLAQAWRIYAFNLSGAGRASESYQALLKHAAILKELLGGAPRDLHVRFQLASNFFLRSAPLQALGDWKGARSALEESIAITEDLLKDEPRNVEFRRHLGWVRMDLGGIHEAQNDFRGMFAEDRMALSLFQSIRAADPTNADARVGVGLANHNLGLARRHTEGPAAALEDFQRARSEYEPLLAADPSNAFLAGYLATLNLHIGETQEQLAAGQGPGRACQSFALAVEGFARLKSAGRLPKNQVESSTRAEHADARCRSASAAGTRR
jgi:eukaryotic-like serine/threonine-protein kinase